MKTGKIFKCHFFSLQFKYQFLNSGFKSFNPPRIGLIVTRKNGNAVVRNRIKRRLREAIRTKLSNDLLSGIDYVIIAHRSITQLSFQDLVKKLKIYFKKVYMKIKINGSFDGIQL